MFLYLRQGQPVALEPEASSPYRMSLGFLPSSSSQCVISNKVSLAHDGVDAEGVITLKDVGEFVLPCKNAPETTQVKLLNLFSCFLNEALNLLLCRRVLSTQARCTQSLVFTDRFMLSRQIAADCRSQTIHQAAVCLWWCAEMFGPFVLALVFLVLDAYCDINGEWSVLI